MRWGPRPPSDPRCSRALPNWSVCSHVGLFDDGVSALLSRRLPKDTRTNDMVLSSAATSPVAPIR